MGRPKPWAVWAGVGAGLLVVAFFGTQGDVALRWNPGESAGWATAREAYGANGKSVLYCRMIALDGPAAGRHGSPRVFQATSEALARVRAAAASHGIERPDRADAIPWPATADFDPRLPTRWVWCRVFYAGLIRPVVFAIEEEPAP